MSGALNFTIDTTQLQAVADELRASEKQIAFAISRACQRTATTLRAQAARGLASELQLRTISLLRNRLKSLRMRAEAGGGDAQLWFGLNDMPASWFKGTPKQTATGATVRGQTFDGGFVAKSKFKGRRTVFKRAGKARLAITEQTLAIEDQALIFVEDQIFDKTEAIFWKHFMRDIQARVKYRIGER